MASDFERNIPSTDDGISASDGSAAGATAANGSNAAGVFYERNIGHIISCLQDGCKDDRLLGVEFENILVKRGSYAP